MAGFEGGCLCGAVRFQSKADPQVVGHCYCADCRKTSGTGHCTHIGVPADGFSVTGEVRFFDTTLTPFTRFTLDNDGRRSASAGLRWTLDDNIAINLEATRNDSAAERDGEVRLEAAVRF